MMLDIDQKVDVCEAGAEDALGGMKPWEYENIGQKTFFFVRRVMQDPAIRARIKQRAAEIRKEKAQASVCAGP